MQQEDITATIRSIAEKYLTIQGNTEFLTNVIRFDGRIKFNRPYSPKDIYNNLDIHSLYQIIVQISYLLYTCYVKKTIIYLSKDIFIYNRKDGSCQFCIEYLLDKRQWGIDERGRKIIQYVDHYFIEYDLRKYQNVYGEIIIRQLNTYIEIAKNITEKQKLPNQNQQNIYEGLNNIINHYLKPKINQIKKPKTIILCLQESMLFRNYSLLLKIINHSLYYSIKSNPQAYQQLQHLKRKQIQIIKKNNLNQNSSPLKNIVNNDDLTLEQIIDHYILYLLKKEIIETDKTYGETNNLQFSTSKQTVVGSVQNIKGQDKKYIASLKVPQKPFKQFNQKGYQSILHRSNDLNNKTICQQEQIEKSTSPQKNEYEIEYLPKKNLICVRYITKIQLNIQNTDIIMYQCNNIPFDLSSVTLELVDKPISKLSKQNNIKKRQKVVAFKTVSHFSQKQQPLTKILLLIDLLMINAKIIQPELKRPSSKLDEYWKIQQLTKKSNHLVNLFIKKVNKAYNEIQNEKLGNEK